MGPLVAIIPVKQLALAKTRLAGALSPDARSALMRESLGRAIGALRASGAVARIIVVTRDPLVADWASAWGADVLRERSVGLNAALREARAAISGADAMLVISGDVALLEPADVTGLAALAATSPAVVIAPDRHGRGTNALLLAPPGIIDVAFGPASAARHAARARAAGIEPAIYHSRTIGLDVDDPDDLALYRTSNPR